MATIKSEINQNVIEDHHKISIGKELESPLTELRQLLANCSTLKAIEDSLDDRFLVKFLRARSCVPAAAHQLLLGYFSMRAENPEMFLLPSELRPIFDARILDIPRQRNSTGNELLLYFNIGKWDPKVIAAEKLVVAGVPFFELEAADGRGVDLLEILDFKELTWGHFWAVPYKLHKLSADLAERALPVVFKRIHVLNEGSILHFMWNIFKVFLTQDFKNRIIFHGSNLEFVKSEIDIELLPEAYGGRRAPSAAAQEMNDEYFKDADKKVAEIWSKYKLCN